MRVSEAAIKLTNKDILSIIDDFVKVEGLKIDSIDIGSFITITGAYEKGIKINFYAKVGISGVIDNIIKIRIFELKVSKLKVFGGITNFALSKILKKFSYLGFSTEDKYILLDIDTLSKQIPFVYFRIKKLTLEDGYINAVVEDIIYTEEKKVKTEKKEAVCKVQDSYKDVRKCIKEKVPQKYEGLVKYAMLLPDFAALLYRLLKDSRVSIKSKIVIGSLLAYLCLPIDIIPDFIPVIGKIDDITIVFQGLKRIFKDVPSEVIRENWEGEGDVISIVNEGLGVIFKLIKHENINKIKNFYIRHIKKGDKNEEGRDIH